MCIYLLVAIHTQAFYLPRFLACFGIDLTKKWLLRLFCHFSVNGHE